MGIKIMPKVKWVGKVDWELETFHGEDYSTHRGSTYNAYLIEDEFNVLIDTVWAPYATEFIKELEKEINLEDIDVVIANHGEIDHSGALPLLMERIPDKPIYCTQNGVKSLKGHYHKDWNFNPVKTGDKLNTGNHELMFIEAPMLHWPDSMFTYMTGTNILFSNDAFGQHYATELLYNDLVDQAELYQEAIKYYANILTPFSPLVKKKIEEFASLNLPLDMICTSHGVIWRDNPMQIVEKYLSWADKYSENQITLIYETMWGGTRRMAEAIAEGIKANSNVTLKLLNAGKADKNDIITEIFKSKAILVGSPTVNKGILSSLAGLLEEIKGLGFKGKKAGAFGTYGWSGESVKRLESILDEAGFELVKEGLLEKWEPDENILDNCRKFGQDFAKEV
jgi:flavorubredoxin